MRLLRKLQKSSKNRHGNKIRRHQLSLQRVEDRRLMAADVSLTSGAVIEILIERPNPNKEFAIRTLEKWNDHCEISKHRRFSVLMETIFCSLMIVAICGQNGFGDVTAYEGFDYESLGENLLGKDGGFGFAGPWYPGDGIGTSPLIITENSLGSGETGSTGNSLNVSSGGGWNGLLRRLSSTIPANATETMYMSFLIRPERGSGTSERPTGWGSVGFIGVVDGHAPWAGYSASRYQMTEFGGQSETKASDVTASVNDEAFFVVRADMTPRQDTFTFYVDPTRGEPEPHTGVVKAENMPGLGRIYVAVGDGAGFSVDEIRLGNTYFDVTPLDVFHVGGKARIGSYPVTSGVRSNLVYEPTGPVSPGLTQEWFQVRNPGNKADLDIAFDNDSPVASPFNASHGSTWWTGTQSTFGQLVKYPAEVTPPMDESRNNNFVVRATGELFLPESGSYRFADGTGEYAYWAIDLDGSGVAGDSAEEVIINDNDPTNPSRSRGGGWGEVELDVNEGGEWLSVEYNMGKTTDRRDAGIIYWDYDPAAPVGQRLGGVAGFPASARDNISDEDAAKAYIPDTHLRSAPFELSHADLTARLAHHFPYEFEIDADTGNADHIVLNNLEPDLLESVLDVDDANFQVVVHGELSEGEKFDLVSADRLIGTPSITVANNTWSWTYNEETGEITVDELFDFDGDNSVSVHDLDLLCGQVRNEGKVTFFDLSDDSLVNSTDVDIFLQHSGRLPGDADLNGDVDFADFLVVASQFGKDGSWSEGNFDCSGRVDFSDFLVLASNFGRSFETSGTAAVPEPSTSLLLLFSIGAFLAPSMRGR